MFEPAKFSAFAFALTLLYAAATACGPSQLEMSAAAEQAEAATAVSNLRSSATVARARMQTTLDFAGTRVMQSEQSGVFLRANLIALGTEGAFIDANLQGLQLLPTSSATRPPLSAPADLAAPATAVGARAVSRPIVTPPSATAFVSPDQPRLDNIVLASGVGRDDCAIDANPAFTPNSAVIYVVARAYNIPSGSTLSSIWQRQGAEVVRLSFTAEFDIDDNCIWFFIDQTDATFTVGGWSVEIFLDGQSLMSPLPFQVVNA